MHSKLIDDSFKLAAAEQLSYVEALSTIRYLAKETDSVAWHAALSNFGCFFDRCNADQAFSFKVIRY